MADSAKRVRTRAICRTCMVSCGVFMEIEDGRVVSLIGDKDDPASHGYTCARGREIATQLYFSYAVGFVEDENPERAEALYRKAMGYGFMRFPELSPDKHVGRGADSTFAATLDKYDADDVPGLLWLGGAWGSVLKLNLSDPSMLAQLLLVEMLTERAVALDADYLYGMPRLMLGTAYALRPPAFGGDSAKALAQFEAGFAVSDRRFLMMHVFFARYYCRQIFDEELFDQTLAELRAADPEALPDVLLLNRMAQEQGQHLEALRDELF